PTVEHTTPDGTIHRVWRSASAEILGPLQRVFAPKKLHVLDGHGRYEAMLAYRDELDARAPLSMYASPNYGLMCLVNLDDITVYGMTIAKHRVVRGKLDGKAILAAAKGKFIVDKLAGAARDAGKQRAALADTVAHQPAFVVAFKGDADAYKLTLSPDVSLTRQGVPVHRGLQKMDPVVVEHGFRPLLGEAVTFTIELDAGKALAAVAGDADAAIITRAVPLDQLIHVDELGELLPAGSTGLAPAISSNLGMLVSPDDDLI
ncbi:MAG: DUF1015 family protein, partial [Proteobacteria bacterium]|nr:DUF1015 family protein [Pseudomonadota bacterium]